MDEYVKEGDEGDMNDFVRFQLGVLHRELNLRLLNTELRQSSVCFQEGELELKNGWQDDFKMRCLAPQADHEMKDIVALLSDFVRDELHLPLAAAATFRVFVPGKRNIFLAKEMSNHAASICTAAPGFRIVLFFANQCI